LLENPRAALAVFDAASQTTVQASGGVTKITEVEEVQRIFSRILTITRTTSGNHLPPLAKMDAGKYIGFRIKPHTLKMAEFVKAEYPPTDQLFENVSLPDDTL
jgi:hypothetical protein